MGYPKEVYDAVEQQFEALRFEAQNNQQLRKLEVQRKVPRIHQIEKEMQTIGLSMVKRALESQDVADETQKIQAEILALRDEQAALLKKHGYPENYLCAQYRCFKCKDFGYVEEGYCDCFKAALRTEANNRANLPVMMDTQSFDTFRLDVYPEESREIMEDVFKICKNFAEHFQSQNGQNLFMYGATGLGKTFLSSCIAKYVLQNGFSVFYQPAYKIFRLFENYKFNNENKDISKTHMEQIMDTDLLVIDDLGAEMVTAFTAEVLFDIINTRLNTKKPTIISTNLDFSDLETIYSQRISSRIMGNYIVLECVGDDIREM